MWWGQYFPLSRPGAAGRGWVMGGAPTGRELDVRLLWVYLLWVGCVDLLVADVEYSRLKVPQLAAQALERSVAGTHVRMCRTQYEVKSPYSGIRPHSSLAGPLDKVGPAPHRGVQVNVPLGFVEF